jgi:hypothetical protein
MKHTVCLSDLCGPVTGDRARRTRLIGGIAAASLVAVVAFGSRGVTADPSVHPAVQWQVDGAPVVAQITGGPWTLQQGPVPAGSKEDSAAPHGFDGNPLADYPNSNPGTEPMQPYYFPFVVGDAKNMNGLFDYRPRNTQEAVVAAHSSDGGRNWTFTSQALNYQPELALNATTDQSVYPLDPVNGNDDGQGHAFILPIGHDELLYTLNRQGVGNNFDGKGHIDSDQLLVRDLGQSNFLDAGDDNPLAKLPNNETPPDPHKTDQHTTGLHNPDGIMGYVRNGNTLEVLYLEKDLNAFTVNGQKGKDDTVVVRLASTTDGINFTDQGIASGLMDPQSTCNHITGPTLTNCTEWVGSRATLVKLDNVAVRGDHARFGLFFSGGRPVDNDSDSFNYIGYAESDDLLHWKVINGVGNNLGLNNPLLTTTGQPATSFFAGRCYDPSVTISLDERTLTLVFAGYNTAKPKNNLANYRTIGVVTLSLAKSGGNN